MSRRVRLTARLTASVLLVGTLAACQANPEVGQESTTSSPTTTAPTEATGPTPPAPQESRTEAGEGLMTFTAGDHEIVLEVTDNPTSRDFIARLPMTVEFEDYANTEMISYLPDSLTTDGSPGSQPSAGDLALYVPWGNLALFYEDFGSHSDDLIPLGTVVEGTEHIDTLADTEVTITVGR